MTGSCSSKLVKSASSFLSFCVSSSVGISTVAFEFVYIFLIASNCLLKVISCPSRMRMFFRTVTNSFCTDCSAFLSASCSTSVAIDVSFTTPLECCSACFSSSSIPSCRSSRCSSSRWCGNFSFVISCFFWTYDFSHFSVHFARSCFTSSLISLNVFLPCVRHKWFRIPSSLKLSRSCCSRWRSFSISLIFNSASSGWAWNFL